MMMLFDRISLGMQAKKKEAIKNQNNREFSAI